MDRDAVPERELRGRKRVERYRAADTRQSVILEVHGAGRPDDIARHHRGRSAVDLLVQDVVVHAGRGRIWREEKDDRLRRTVDAAGRVARIRIGGGGERERDPLCLRQRGHRAGRDIRVVVDGEGIVRQVRREVGVERDHVRPGVDEGRLRVRQVGARRAQPLLHGGEREFQILHRVHPIASQRHRTALRAQEAERPGHHRTEHDEGHEQLDEREARRRARSGSHHGAATVTVRAMGASRPGPLTVTVIFL